MREQCRREEEATHPLTSRPATPRGTATRLLHYSRSAPSPPVAVVPRRASLVVVAPRLSPRPADVAPRPSPCSTGRPRIAAVPVRAPSGARKPSRGLSGTRRRAPPRPSSPGSFTWRPTPSWTRAERPTASPAARRRRLHRDGARGRFSRRDRLHTAPGGGSCNRDAVRGRRRTSCGRHGCRTSPQLSTLGVFKQAGSLTLSGAGGESAAATTWF